MAPAKSSGPPSLKVILVTFLLTTTWPNDQLKSSFSSTDPGLYSASVTWPNPNITDNSGNFTIDSSHVPGSTFPPGTTSVTINAVDASQNRASCTFNITVVDTEPPVLNCSDRIVVSTLPGLNYSIVSIPSPVVTDNSLLEPVTSNDTLTAELPIGVFDVELSATDLAGNEETCFVRVEVQDRESPNITCPDDILEVLQPNSSSVNITWSVPAVVDNSGEFTYPVSVPESGSLFGIGNTTVNVSSADPSGNVGSCQFVVIVTANDRDYSAIESIQLSNVSYYLLAPRLLDYSPLLVTPLPQLNHCG
ncbi:hyalin-like [Diadema setosum]|uniref:hyalin-like n=1 Tax=Diadema setosum TaxID=31175 RepID=UPI003B3AD77C